MSLHRSMAPPPPTRRRRESVDLACRECGETNWRQNEYGTCSRVWVYNADYADIYDEETNYDDQDGWCCGECDTFATDDQAAALESYK